MPRRKQYDNPVTDDDLRRIREMHAVGFSRNQIARELGRSNRTITIHANRMNLVFDRSGTEAATAARKADLEERRVILAEALQGDAEMLTERLWQKYHVFNFGGSDNRYASKVVDEPPADAKKNLMSAAGIAIDKSLKLCPPAGVPGEDEARSMLGMLAEGIRIIANSPDQTGDSVE